MEKGDFKSWDDAIKFYKEEYKDLHLEEFMDRMTMRWEDGEFEDIQAFSKAIQEGIKLQNNPPEKKSMDLEPEKKGIPIYLSKWAKEVVKYLLINGETKNADIMDYLRTGLKMDTSYDHLSAIFKTEKARAFYRKELVKDGSYFSLKDPNKFQ